jgi:hypothetical protein
MTFDSLAWLRGHPCCMWHVARYMSHRIVGLRAGCGGLHIPSGSYRRHVARCLLHVACRDLASSENAQRRGSELLNRRAEDVVTHNHVLEHHLRPAGEGAVWCFPVRTLPLISTHDIFGILIINDITNIGLIPRNAFPLRFKQQWSTAEAFSGSSCASAAPPLGALCREHAVSFYASQRRSRDLRIADLEGRVGVPFACVAVLWYENADGVPASTHIVMRK